LPNFNPGQLIASLKRLECYESLGLTEEAKKMAGVLGHNFPGSEWYIDSFENVENVKVRTIKEKPWWKPW